MEKLSLVVVIALMLILAVSSPGALHAVSRSPYVGIVVAGHSNDTLYAFDMQTGTMSWKAGTGSRVLDVEISLDNRFVVAGCSQSLRLYDINGVLHWTTSRGVRGGTWFIPDVNSVSISANCSYIAAAHADGTIRLYNGNGTEIWNATFPGVRTVDISSDGTALVVGGSINTRYYSDGGDGWDAGDNTPVWSNSNGARIVAIAGDGSYAVGGLEDDVHLYGSTSGAPIWSYALLPEIVTCDISLDGTKVAAGNDDPGNTWGAVLHLFDDGGDGWDSGDNIPVWSFDASTSGGDDIRAIRFSPDGGFLSAGGADHYAKTRIFSTASNVPLITSTLLNETLSLGISQRGVFTASCGHAKVWVNTKNSDEPLWTYEQSSGEFNAVDISECPAIKLVTGGGWIPGNGVGSKRSFGFNAHSEGDGVWGQLQFNDHWTKMKVHSEIMKTLVIYGDTVARFSGDCKVDGLSGYSFECEVEDRGEPGHGADKFSIDICDAAGSPVYSAGGFLGGGNIQIHTSPGGDFAKGGSEPVVQPPAHRAPLPRTEEREESGLMAQRPYLNCPNLFRRSIVIHYSVHRSKGAGAQGSDLSTHQRINLSVYDLAGRLVRVLVDKPLPTSHCLLPTSAVWDGKDSSGRCVAPGMYFCRLTVGDSAITGKVILLR